MKLFAFLITWLRRLPLLFTGLFVSGMVLYLLLVSAGVKAGGVQTISGLLWTLLGFPRVPPAFGIGIAVSVFWEGLVVVFFLFVGVVLSYNGAAWVYRAARRQPTVAVTAPAPPAAGGAKRLERFNRVGIILAGGGAKGAYQAGAMKAIHEFLEENGALSKVRMIAGTSIGSWNAMFWLAGLVKAKGSTSAHEAWWRSISLSRIVEFDTYWPLRTNHFLLPTPWREAFGQIFKRTPSVRSQLARLFTGPADGAEPPLHFYFTRSNVERGQLEFATNWPAIATLTRPNLRTPTAGDEEPVVAPDRYEVIAGGSLDEQLGRTERAVFASMDLPPLFPYLPIKLDMTEWFEDGGVVENLPVWFGTQIEQCDLLFVLPLNASFAEPVNHTSVVKRLFRVMDVRQGVIERNAMKLSYLYNELAALRAMIDDLQEKQRAAAAESGGRQSLETMVLKRQHRPISVFAICPAPPLGIGTAEFWKGKEAGSAFELMYAATKYELAENFEAGTDPNWLRMTLVNPQGERAYTDEF